MSGSERVELLLGDVAMFAREWRAVRLDFEAAMREAVDAGASLNQVAVVAGLSRSRVWQIVKSERSEQ